jgi:acyl transferase domain-containing protein
MEQVSERVINFLPLSSFDISKLTCIGLLGTQAGDNAEIRSLRSVLTPERSSDNPLYLSSIKGNIGHAEAASGAAGLAKLILMMEKALIPPQASLEHLNPSLKLTPNANITIPRQLTQWKPREGSRRTAMLNNFGAAGSNVALILEQYSVETPQTHRSQQRSCHLLNISAKSASALEDLRSAFISLLERKKGQVDPNNLCFSTNCRRAQFPHYRLSVTGRTIDELSNKLQRADIIGQAPTGDAKRTVFVFSGQGGIFYGMGAELLNTSRQFDKIVRECDQILAQHGFPPVSPRISGSQAGSEELHDDQKIVIEQCACFVVQYALAKVLISYGIIPGLVIGHRYRDLSLYLTAFQNADLFI